MPNVVIVLILVISVVTDLRNRKILNIVTLPAILGALIYHFNSSGLEGFLFSGQGFLVGLGLFFIPFILGGIGAGDVKLLAALGAWKGAYFIFYTGIYAAIFSGIIALFILLKRRELGFTLNQILLSAIFWKSKKESLLVKDNKQSSVSSPYAVPIALGSVFTFLIEITL